MQSKQKATLISLVSNLAIFANLLVGFLHIHWLVVPVFVLVHAVLRLSYLKAQNELTAHDGNTTQTTIAPPMVRNIASVITAVILAVAIYAVGYGIGLLLK